MLDGYILVLSQLYWMHDLRLGFIRHAALAACENFDVFVGLEVFSRV